MGAYEEQRCERLAEVVGRLPGPQRAQRTEGRRPPGKEERYSRRYNIRFKLSFKEI